MQNNYKILLLIRHAKSSWDTGISDDFDRPLNERGIKDAPVMAGRLKNKITNIDALISSPAKRAKKTAEYFANTFDFKHNDIVFIPRLYHADVDTFFEVTEGLDNKYNTVAIFSHNPGITEFAAQLCNNVSIDNMPTCAVFGVKINTLKWNDFRKAPKEFLLFDYPKNI